MDERYARELPLVGEGGLSALRAARVAVIGLGGVGGTCVEALARAGVGHLFLVDGDAVSVSNLNRQIIATEATVGRKKTDAAKKRLLAIDGSLTLDLYPVFVGGEEELPFSLSDVDYIVDAIDDVAAKCNIARRATAAGVPLISAMGAGNKLDPTKFKVADLAKTSVDPLARAMRQRLGKDGIRHLKVVFSDELPVKIPESGERVGSISFVPAAAGLVLAGEVIKDLIKGK